MKLLLCAVVLATVVAEEKLDMKALNEKYSPKYDGFENKGVDGVITMYATTHRGDKQVSMSEVEKKDAEAGFGSEHHTEHKDHATLFQDNPLLKIGYDQVAAGKDGFRFKQSQGGKEVYCAEKRKKDGLRTADGHAIEFKFTCNAVSEAEKHRFSSWGNGGYWAGVGYPYHWNGGGYFGSGWGYPWYGNYGGGWGWGWGNSYYWGRPGWYY